MVVVRDQNAPRLPRFSPSRSLSLARQSLTCPGIAVLPFPPVRLPRPATFPLAASRPVIHRAALLLATHTLSPCPRPRPASLSLVQQSLASRSAAQIMDRAFPNVTTIWHGLNLR